MHSKTQKIFVGVSGGVDSSVAVYLLKKEGHDVHGVFIKTWSPEWLPCTWVEEKRDAMRVCARLDIPFHFLDAEKEYKDGVADYMIAEYRAGRTPNPDVLCNRVIKFGVLWDYARSHGADAVATGHYARIVNRDELVVSSKKQEILTASYSLLTGSDTNKDQSYFLWMLTSKDLDHIRFPIGHLQKSEVRTIAKKANLFTAEKKDSQGICFLGDVDMREFLSHYIALKKGNVIDEHGGIIGEHDGVWFYTLGERHGFKITIKSISKKPYYIVGKDIEKNELIVSDISKNKNSVHGQVIVALRNVNWLIPPVKNKIYNAQSRYHGEFIHTVVLTNTTVMLIYDGVLAFGQSLVLYDGEMLVGAGIIDKLLADVV